MRLKFFKDGVLMVLNKIDSSESKAQVLDFCDSVEVQGLCDTDVSGILNLMLSNATSQKWDVETFLGSTRALLSMYEYSKELRWSGGVL